MLSQLTDNPILFLPFGVNFVRDVLLRKEFREIDRILEESIDIGLRVRGGGKSDLAKRAGCRLSRLNISMYLGVRLNRTRGGERRTHRHPARTLVTCWTFSRARCSRRAMSVSRGRTFMMSS